MKANKKPKILLLSQFNSELLDKDFSLESTNVYYKPLKPIELHNMIYSIFTDSLQSSIAEKKSNDTYESFAHAYPKKILLVEDNLVNQKIAMRMLKQFGYSADLTPSDLEAIEAVKQQRYDLILMDVQMPEMNGLDATRHIRSMDLEAQPTIGAMSAAAMIEDHQTALQSGMDDYIDKPISIDEFIKVLKQPTPTITMGYERLNSSERAKN